MAFVPPTWSTAPGAMSTMPKHAPIAWDDAVAAHVLKSKFGHSAFRGQQLEAIRACACGRDVLYVAATGTGKSLCFQFLTQYRRALEPGSRSVTVVVSPLIALMEDQVLALRASGFSACALNSNNHDGKEWTAAAAGEVDFIYMAPETLQTWSGNVQALAARGLVDLVAVDEAHIVTEWGLDFRPEYRRLSILRDLLPTTPIMALTATATPIVRRDIGAVLKLRDPLHLLSTFDRPNLHYSIRLKSSLEADLRAVMQPFPGPTIIYVMTQADTERIATAINAMRVPRKAGETACATGAGAADTWMTAKDTSGSGAASAVPARTPSGSRPLPFARATSLPGAAASPPDVHLSRSSASASYVCAAPYHAGMTPDDRTRVHRAYLTGAIDVIVATVAFGMGIDKRDIRCIIHYGSPKGVEAYYQQTGRAGRDGDPAGCVLLYAMADFGLMSSLSSSSREGAEQVRQGISDMQQFVMSGRCRRRMILEHFGELPLDSDVRPDASTTFKCSGCDICDAAATPAHSDKFDFTEHARMLAQAIAVCHGRPPTSLPINLVRGSANKKVLEKFSPAALKTFPFYRAGIALPDKYWHGVMRLLTQKGLAVTETHQLKDKHVSYTSISLTPTGAAFARDTRKTLEPMAIPADLLPYLKNDSESSTAPRFASMDMDAGLSNSELALRDALMAVRERIAAGLGLPAYHVCSTRALREMARVRPSTLAAMQSIEEMDALRVSKYGPAFIETIARESAMHGLECTASSAPAHVGSAPSVGHSRSQPQAEELTPAQQSAWTEIVLHQRSLAAVAAAKSIKPSTLFSHVYDALQRGALWTETSRTLWEPAVGTQAMREVLLTRSGWQRLAMWFADRVGFAREVVTAMARAIVRAVVRAPGNARPTWVACAPAMPEDAPLGPTLLPGQTLELLSSMRLKEVIECEADERLRQYDVLRSLLWFTKQGLQYASPDDASPAGGTIAPRPQPRSEPQRAAGIRDAPSVHPPVVASSCTAPTGANAFDELDDDALMAVLDSVPGVAVPTPSPLKPVSCNSTPQPTVSAAHCGKRAREDEPPVPHLPSFSTPSPQMPHKIAPPCLDDARHVLRGMLPTTPSGFEAACAQAWPASTPSQVKELCGAAVAAMCEAWEVFVDHAGMIAAL